MYKIGNCASKIDEAEVQHYTSEEGNRLDQGSSISKGMFKNHYSIVWNRRSPLHTGRNCFNLFQISFSANTTDTDPGVSGVSKDQKNCEKSKTTHCQVDHSPIIE